MIVFEVSLIPSDRAGEADDGRQRVRACLKSCFAIDDGSTEPCQMG